ncbi:MAG: IS5 family transposase [Burkholderiales bacterium]|nr:IS5 family transposase [Burkholderiales bacterium]
MIYERIENLKPEEVKRLTGVYPDTFSLMVKIVSAEKAFHKKSGRPSKLSVEEQILMALEYWREYRTYYHIGTSRGIDETTAMRIIKKVEDILIKSGLFNLPGKKTLVRESISVERVGVDVTEHEIERPKKKQKRYYSGKQKCHTIKSQIVADVKTRMILCTAFGTGRTHDFKVWKTSRVMMNKRTECLADKGYQGIQKLHENSKIPQKRKSKQELTKEQKKFNRQLSRERVVIENIHRHLKIFRILSSRYRNRRKRFKLRLNLLAGIYNYELSLEYKLAEG